MSHLPEDTFEKAIKQFLSKNLGLKERKWVIENLRNVIETLKDLEDIELSDVAPASVFRPKME